MYSACSICNMLFSYICVCVCVGEPVQCTAWAGQCALYILIMMFEKVFIILVLLIPQWKKVSDTFHPKNLTWTAYNYRIFTHVFQSDTSTSNLCENARYTVRWKECAVQVRCLSWIFSYVLCLDVRGAQLAMLNPITNPQLELALVMLIVPFFVNVSGTSVSSGEKHSLLRRRDRLS